MTAQEKADYVAAVKALKSAPSPYESGISYYDQFVKWHYLAFYCHSGMSHMEGMFPAHMNPAFLPWHRCYLDIFEKALQEVSGKDITIPYWDWTDPACNAAVFADDFMGGSGDPAQGYKLVTGPFRASEWVVNISDDIDIDSIFLDVNTDPNPQPYLIRALGIFKNGTVSLPTAQDVQFCLDVATYDSYPWDSSVDTAISFRNSIEGWRGCGGNTCENDIMDVISLPNRRSVMHNIVHIYVGGVFPGQNNNYYSGNMAQSTSPADPIFWIHHSNIDRLWSAWMKRHGRQYAPASGGPMGSNLNDVMEPFSFRTDGFNTPASLLDESKLGIQYDVIP